MKLCILSKYPPIEGQVSTVNYWLARGLAQRGHHVTVVTNANEVENPCRLYLEVDAEHGADWYEPSFGEGGGDVRVLNTTPFGASQFYIPWANPFVTKLASLARQAVRELGAEIIFSHYLEPYAVAGHLATAWTAAPHIITHSGSDLGRLMQDSNLRPVYQEIIQQAACFVPKNRLGASFAPNGNESPSGLAAYAPPEAYFHPGVGPLDVNRLLGQASQYIQTELGWHVREFNPELPTLGIYGKLFEVKGTYDLVEAFGRLAKTGHKANLLIMSRWRRGEERLREAIRSAGIEESVWLLPFLPNWHVPGFIRLCRAICYLERGFPMPIHTSVVPKEVLACGVCLVLSGEARKAGWYREHMRDGETCVVVEDPTRTDTLVERLRFVLENPERATAIGEAGYRAAKSLSTHDDFLAGWEALFRRVALSKDNP